jgi:hypothetical protein
MVIQTMMEINENYAVASTSVPYVYYDYISVKQVAIWHVVIP